MNKKSPINKKPRWHLVYYALAAVDVLTILLSLYLNHIIVEKFSHSVRINQEWAVRLDKFAELSSLAGKVNAPGNDVFDSKDVSLEAPRLEAAKIDFDRNLGILKKEILQNVESKEATSILANLTRVEESMNTMIAEAEQIFDYFKNQEEQKAGERMATMDRKYSILNDKIANLNAQIRKIQSDHLKEQEDLSKKLVFFEYLIVIAILFIIIAVTIYGRRLSIAMGKAEEERSKYFVELENYKAAMDAHAIISMADLKGNIVYVNKKFCEISKYSVEELLGKNHNIINSKYHPSEFWQEMWKTIASGQVWHGEIKNKAKDGSFYWVNSTMFPFKNAQGEIIQYYSIRTDISQVKMTQDELVRLSREALAAAQAKSNFLANMSHEIRTPMNAILGFSALLSQTELNKDQQEYMKTIQSSGSLLINIINDILDFSKIEAGKIKLESINFNLEYLISDVFKIISSRLVDKDIHTFIDIDLQDESFVIGDPTRIRQVLINLLGNAIKFTEKGEIGIIVRKDLEKSTADELMLHITVRDTGIGISPDSINKLFQAFSQADDSTTRKFGGTGLGLTISKNLVGLMGGNMWVESHVGKGSDFIFSLRLKKGQSIKDQHINPLSISALKDKKIMIIDDNKHSCYILQKYCLSINLNVVAIVSEAEMVMETLKKLLESGNLPDLILSDIMMPNMDGYQLAQLIRNNKQYDGVKLLAVSSDIRLGIMDKLKEKGFNGFLPKPVTRDEVLKVIATILGDYRTQGPIVNRHMAEELSVKGAKILLVEDVKANQLLMKAYFNMMGCHADYACNGQEAIDMISKNTYDLCLMDVQMPVMGGIEATQIIRERINKTIPIIALTANVMEEDRQKCLTAGMNDYLSKPIDVNQLKVKIRDTLNYVK